LVAGQAGAVDRVVRLGAAAVGTGGRGLDRCGDRIAVGLGGEAPHVALEDRAACRGGVDLVHSPVVGLAEVQETGRIEVCGRLALAEEHAGRSRPGGRVHVVEHSPKVDVMRDDVLAGRPAQGRIARHVGRALGWIGATTLVGIGESPLHDLPDLCRTQRIVEDIDLIDGPFERTIGGALEVQGSDDDGRPRPGAQGHGGGGRLRRPVDVHGRRGSVVRERHMLPFADGRSRRRIDRGAAAETEADAVGRVAHRELPPDRHEDAVALGDYPLEGAGGIGARPLDPGGHAHLPGTLGRVPCPSTQVIGRGGVAWKVQSGAETRFALGPLDRAGDGGVMPFAGSIFRGGAAAFVHGVVGHDCGGCRTDRAQQQDRTQ